MEINSESKDLFRATLSKTNVDDEVSLEVFMTESVLKNLTEEQIDKVYLDIVNISNYLCSCVTENNKKNLRK